LGNGAVAEEQAKEDCQLWIAACRLTERHDAAVLARVAQIGNDQ
jgi:hypothetical protein